MRQWLRSIDWTPILASALILQIALSVLPFLFPYFPGHPSEQHNPHANREVEDQDHGPWWVKLVSLEAIFTGIIAGFSALQYRASEKTAKRQLRAYVFVTTKILELRDGILFAEFVLENTGQTPAYAVNCCSDGWIDSSEDRSKEPDLDEDDTPTCIGPGDTISVFQPIDYEASDLDEIRNGNKAVYAAIEVTYSDAFKENWRTYAEVYLTGKRRWEDADDRRGTIIKYDAD